MLKIADVACLRIIIPCIQCVADCWQLRTLRVCWWNIIKFPSHCATRKKWEMCESFFWEKSFFAFVLCTKSFLTLGRKQDFRLAHSCALSHSRIFTEFSRIPSRWNNKNTTKHFHWLEFFPHFICCSMRLISVCTGVRVAAFVRRSDSEHQCGMVCVWSFRWEFSWEGIIMLMIFLRQILRANRRKRQRTKRL